MNKTQLVFGYDHTKPIGYILRDRRDDGIIHNHLNIMDWNENKEKNITEHESYPGC